MTDLMLNVGRPVGLLFFLGKNFNIFVSMQFNYDIEQNVMNKREEYKPFKISEVEMLIFSCE